MRFTQPTWTQSLQTHCVMALLDSVNAKGLRQKRPELCMSVTESF